MGYYANGSGSITFRKMLTSDDQRKLREIIDTAWCDYDFFLDKEKNGVIGVDFWAYEKYYGDDVERALKEIAEQYTIQSGEIDYIGEDYSMWRFLFVPDNDSGRWTEQEGHVEYE